MLAQFFIKTLHADILFFKDNCGDSYIKNLAKFYFLIALSSRITHSQEDKNLNLASDDNRFLYT